MDVQDQIGYSQPSHNTFRSSAPGQQPTEPPCAPRHIKKKMPKILIINGPNLNNLGKRDSGHYGSTTLDEINAAIKSRAMELAVDTSYFQSNHEGAIVDHIQANSAGADGVIINCGALTQVGYSILDALLDSGTCCARAANSLSDVGPHRLRVLL